MNIYVKKRRWKLILFFLAFAIVSISLWYTNVLVHEFAENERTNVKIWANAIQRRANLVNYANRFFEQIRQEEEKRAELLAETYKRITADDYSNDLTFYVEIIRKNTTIPLILTDENDSILNTVNVDFNTDTLKILRGKMKKEFTNFSPIEIRFSNTKKQILYYKESIIYTELRNVLDDLIETFFSEVVTNSVSVPVIVTNSNRDTVIAFGNTDPELMEDTNYIRQTLAQMEFQNEPIKISLPESGTTLIFYKDSKLLTQIQYYPFIQFLVIAIFFLIAYYLFSTARKSEQNQVWVGMSKETAHQLGTPLSSLIAWIELLKIKGMQQEVIGEIENDLQRLENITERFSKIGSSPSLEKQNIVEIIYDSLAYIKKRTSKKVNYTINIPPDRQIIAPLNKNLFEWVIENLCKNAVDAMNGIGNITVDVAEENKYVFIDIADSGKGISRKNFKTVFHPGFTSKKRGWGLGLSLSKRIIENYHSGKIFVKNSVINQGTTFRIQLKK